jgi:APA family basic amino acid/polyamine antiporter
MTQEGIFVRKASGLIRRVSPFQALSYSFQAPALLLVAIYMIWGTILYPGANFFVGSWIMPLVMYPSVLIYVLLAIAMPRSGGEYLYVSRSLGPGWGLFTSWAMTINSYIWPGLLTQFGIYYSVPPLLMALGNATANPALRDLAVAISDPANPAYIWMFIMGIIFLIFSNLVHYAGVQWVARVSVVAFFAIFIEFVIWTLIFGTTNPTSFVASVEKNLGVVFQKDVVDVAAATPGFVSGTVFSMSIFAGAVYVSQNTLASTFPANFCGEVKSVAKTQWMSQVVSIALYAVLYTYVAGLVYYGIGLENYQAISQLTTIGAAAPYYSAASQLFGTFPSFFILAMFATDNMYLPIVSCLVYIVAMFCSVAALPMGASRNMFAYSIDGIFPGFLSKVDRRGSPWILCLIAAIMSFFTLYLALYTRYLEMIAYSTGIWFVGWTFLGIGAIAFPYAKGSRGIYEKAPPIVRRKILGIPILVILGVLGALSSAWIVYICFLPAFTGGVLALIPLTTTVAVCSGFPWIVYGLARLYNRWKKINMDIRFKEIPPD